MCESPGWFGERERVVIASSGLTYFLCCTPRTGSTFLCSLLEATAKAGRPASFFRSQDVERRVDEWGIREVDGSFRFANFVAAAKHAGRSGNGVLGIRVMWGTMTELVDQLRASGRRGSDSEVLAATFGTTRFVYLERRDAVFQAISRHRAEVSSVWHVTGEQGSGPAVAYDRDSIRRFVDETREHNRAWREWFRMNDIEPLVIAYEDLDRDNLGETNRVLAYLGVDAEFACLDVANVRMADDTTKQWADRFRAEMRS